ncbi:hypothetical protein DPMN_018937 [Dreissena polymorpha]|uniref:Uncharacterized protein n=1 Tax=Dreissena polymorpha TaxID=45954 RepID=A0A9D4S8U6_DREPO|nr:hypothetical protein DPMN_018937 [Dreissena polymorpha]
MAPDRRADGRKDGRTEGLTDNAKQDNKNVVVFRRAPALISIWPAGAPIQNHPFPPLIPSSSHWTSGLKGSSARRDVIAVLMVMLTIVRTVVATPFDSQPEVNQNSNSALNNTREASISAQLLSFR